ncbi:TonB-dependent siderophore receptor [Pelagicoccus mobilis]|uniref:TonB-dependent receptor n=1 Tax=Pelagicoccus mobilis TaxID=415221 RepID=A0A934VTM7_9BACT|nr:TonB-dependent receptor [Pelagicoccus mobilis]MBK1879679.1 TonB-dependent receptor [Pelagicoccus mobilis]
MKRNKATLWATALTLSASPLLHYAYAQSTDDEIFNLQPFQVTSNREEGYRATSTISASRLNVQLDEVPVNIPVMTADFIDDTVSVTQREALEWHAAVEGKNVRGFGTEEFYRHGFQHLSDTQGFLIQRMEIVRGPTAILSGPIHPGGAINVITKQAVLDSNFGEARFQHTFAENHSYGNIGFDINAGNLGKDTDYGNTMAFRFTGAYQQDSGRGAWTGNDYGAGLMSFRWRPQEETIITAEYYNYKLDSDRTDHMAGLRLNMPTDSATGFQKPVGLAAREQGYSDIINGANWLGPDASAPERNNEFIINVNHKFNDFFFVDASFTRADRDLDFINMMHGNGMGTYQLRLKDGAPAGSQDVDDYLIYRRLGPSRLIGNIVDQIGVMATWIPDFTENSNHKVMFGYQSFEQDKLLDFKWYKEIGTGELWHSPVEISDYPRGDLSYDFSLLYEDVHLDRQEVNEQDTLFVNWTGEWLDERLHTMFGLFNTDLSQNQTNFGTAKEVHDSSKTLPQIGAVYDFTEDFGMYASFTESAAINSNQAPPADNADFHFPPKSGEMREIGFRFDLLDKKLVGSLGIYEVNQTDVVSYNSETEEFVNLGDVESTGYDLDIFYYPTANWSVIFGWAHNDKDVPALIASTGGTAADRNAFASPPNKYSLWTKYTIKDGPMHGVSFGGGFKLVEGTPTERTVNGTTYRASTPDRTRFDLFVQKKGMLNDDVEYYVSLNARNLTGKELINQNPGLGSGIAYGWRPNSALRYEFDQDPEYTVTTGLKW